MLQVGAIGIEEKGTVLLSNIRNTIYNCFHYSLMFALYSVILPSSLVFVSEPF
jgi:hypothetical protein